MESSPTAVPETERLFLRDTYLFHCQAKVVMVEQVGTQEGKRECLVYLDRTLFHP